MLYSPDDSQREFLPQSESLSLPFKRADGRRPDEPRPVSKGLCIDLACDEDSSADVDFNVVMTDSHRFVEIQGTAEGATFERSQLDDLIGLAESGIDSMLEAQKSALAGVT